MLPLDPPAAPTLESSPRCDRGSVVAAVGLWEPAGIFFPSAVASAAGASDAAPDDPSVALAADPQYAAALAVIDDPATAAEARRILSSLGP